MKITLIISSLSCGGAERVICDMANYWAERDHQITVITSTGRDVEDFYFLHPSVKRVRLCHAKQTAAVFDKIFRNLLRVTALRRSIRDSRPDAIISFMDVNNILTILATRCMEATVVVSERTDPSINPYIALPWKFLRRLCYRLADSVVAQTETAAAWLDSHCATKSKVIPNALRELPINTPWHVRDKLILAVGRLGREKGYDCLIRAFARVVNDFPEWRLAILGDGPERSVLEEMIRTYGLERVVTMPGRVGDPETWMRRAAIFAMTSRFEGFPNALLEAMGMGAAVISTDCRSGPNELVTHGVNGLLVGVDDEDGLAAAFAELMENNCLRDRIGGNAVEVRTRFSQGHIMGLWEGCISKR